MQFYTIGVYGKTSEEFFHDLVSNQIDTFVDLRRRRAVRGSNFSFVNSKKLQTRLQDLEIKYLHILELAPTNEIRELQKENDKTLNVAKRKRGELGEVFKKEYRAKILDKYDLKILIKQLEILNAQKIVLFCVEKEPKACHRSLISDKLQEKFLFTTYHL
jgi:uncharacterized protein (DUF488 family)